MPERDEALCALSVSGMRGGDVAASKRGGGRASQKAQN